VSKVEMCKELVAHVMKVRLDRVNHRRLNSRLCSALP
jgi:hypothetical protein